MNERRDSDTGYIILSYLLAGVGGYGLLGWLLDRFLHTSVFLPLGLILGAGLSLYIVVKRFGGDDATTTSAEDTSSQGEESE